MYEAPQVPVLERSTWSKQIKTTFSSHLLHAPWCTICCRARTIDDPCHVVTHDESVDSLPKIVCGCAELKMKGDTTPKRVRLVVDSSTGYLGAIDVDQKGGSCGSAATWMAKWLVSTGCARMKVQSDAID